MGKPKDLKVFNIYKADGIDVYIRKGIKARNNEVNIVMSKLFCFERLDVGGII